MDPNIVSICPRCEHELELHEREGGGLRLVLGCPEAHCDYVLVLARAEPCGSPGRDAAFLSLTLAG